MEVEEGWLDKQVDADVEEVEHDVLLDEDDMEEVEDDG